MNHTEAKRSRRVVILLLLLTGLAVLFYPLVSMKWNDYRSRKLETTYADSVGSMKDPQLEEMRRAAAAYNKTLYVPSVPDAFSIRDGVHDPEYESLLDPGGDGIMAYIEIPAIQVDLPVYHYTTDDSLGKGAGHLFGSSLPVGGRGTHCVISAHRGLPNARMFTDLNLVKEGDRFYIKVLNRTLTYQVDQILTVKPDQTQSLAIDRQKDLVTLVTCTPYAVNSHRLLVRGHRISDKESGASSAAAAGIRIDKHRLIGQILSAAAGFLGAFAILSLTVFRRQKGEENEDGK